jgi:hypothetical protein
MPSTGGQVTKKRVDPAKQIKKAKTPVSPKIGFINDKDQPGTIKKPIVPTKQTTTTSTGSTGGGLTGAVGNAQALISGSVNQSSSPTGDFNTGTGGTKTAFGNAFLPAMYGEAWSNPDTLVRELFRQKGIGTQGGTYAATLDQADKLGLLWMLQQGNDVLSTLNTGLQGANMPDIIRAAYMARARELADTYQNQRMRSPSGGTFLNSLSNSGYLNSLGGG